MVLSVLLYFAPGSEHEFDFAKSTHCGEETGHFGWEVKDINGCFLRMPLRNTCMCKCYAFIAIINCLSEGEIWKFCGKMLPLDETSVPCLLNRGR